MDKVSLIRERKFVRCCSDNLLLYDLLYTILCFINNFEKLGFKTAKKMGTARVNTFKFKFEGCKIIQTILLIIVFSNIPECECVCLISNHNSLTTIFSLLSSAFKKNKHMNNYKTIIISSFLMILRHSCRVSANSTSCLDVRKCDDTI